MGEEVGGAGGRRGREGGGGEGVCATVCFHLKVSKTSIIFLKLT